MKGKWIGILLMVTAALFFGCSSGGGGEEVDDPGKKVGKGDCPDCDPAGPSAFEQANLGLRFYLAGDAWQVAYQFKVRNDMARENLKAQQLPADPAEWEAVLQDTRVSVSDPYLFDYEVLETNRAVIDNVQRDVAVINVSQGTPDDAGLFSFDRLDTHEYALRFELDDLLRPVRETFFNREYPHGKTIEVDKESSLSALESGSNLFPHTVPRVLVAAPAGEVPVMTAELEAIADAKVPGWRNDSYMKYGFPNGDVVYWATGKPWPFYVDSQQGYGLLINLSLAAR